MTTVIRIPVPHDTARLAEELADAGYVVTGTEQVGYICCGTLHLEGDVDPTVFDALFAAHVPMPLPPPATVSVERTALEAVVGQMHADGSRAAHGERDASAEALKRFL